MTETTQPATRTFRNRLFFHLMDFATVCLVIGFAAFIYTHWYLGEHVTNDSNPAFIAAGILVIIAYILAPILIAVKPLRDEYADLLWQRTARKVMLILAIVPLLIWLTVTIAHAIIGGDTPPPVLAWLFEDVTIYLALRQAWVYFVLLFILTFQVLRWWDAR